MPNSSSSALMWALATGITAGSAWAGTAFAAQVWFDLRIAEPISETLFGSVKVMAATGALWGLLGGAILGRRRARGKVALWMLGGAALGAATASAIALTADANLGLFATTLVVSLGALPAGFAAHVAAQRESTIPVTAPRRLGTVVGILARVGSTFAITASALLVLLQAFPTIYYRNTGSALFGIGSLGFILVWVLLGQELRIRELERIVRDREPKRDERLT